MTTEQRLADALAAARSFEPSPDLWNRVVHSIEEDTKHRRRIRSTAATLALLGLVAVVIALTGLEPLPLRLRTGVQRIDWRLMEALETIVLVGLVLTLGPAIRRFGRGYVGDIISGATGVHLLRLLDVAYYLVFSGFVLMTTRLVPPMAYFLGGIGAQVEEAMARIGGLLLVMGLLHAVTLMVMPLVGLVINATRAGAALPKWVRVVLLIGGILVAFEALMIVAGLIGGAQG